MNYIISPFILLIVIIYSDCTTSPVTPTPVTHGSEQSSGSSGSSGSSTFTYSYSTSTSTSTSASSTSSPPVEEPCKVVKKKQRCFMSGSKCVNYVSEGCFCAKGVCIWGGQYQQECSGYTGRGQAECEGLEPLTDTCAGVCGIGCKVVNGDNIKNCSIRSDLYQGEVLKLCVVYKPTYCECRNDGCEEDITEELMCLWDSNTPDENCNRIQKNVETTCESTGCVKKT